MSAVKRNVLGAVLLLTGLGYVAGSVLELHSHPNIYLALGLVGLGCWMLDRPDMKAALRAAKALRKGGA